MTAPVESFLDQTKTLRNYLQTFTVVGAIACVLGTVILIGGSTGFIHVEGPITPFMVALLGVIVLSAHGVQRGLSRGDATFLGPALLGVMSLIASSLWSNTVGWMDLFAFAGLVAGAKAWRSLASPDAGAWTTLLRERLKPSRLAVATAAGWTILVGSWVNGSIERRGWGVPPQAGTTSTGVLSLTHESPWETKAVRFAVFWSTAKESAIDEDLMASSNRYNRWSDSVHNAPHINRASVLVLGGPRLVPIIFDKDKRTVEVAGQVLHVPRWGALAVRLDRDASGHWIVAESSRVHSLSAAGNALGSFEGMYAEAFKAPLSW